MGFANEYLYTGRRYDAESGLYQYFDIGTSDPVAGRFISRDPVRTTVAHEISMSMWRRPFPVDPFGQNQILHASHLGWLFKIFVFFNDADGRHRH